MHETFLKEVTVLHQQHLNTSVAAENAQLKAIVMGLIKISPFLKMYKPICLGYTNRIEAFEDCKVISCSYLFAALDVTSHKVPWVPA